MILKLTVSIPHSRCRVSIPPLRSSIEETENRIKRRLTMNKDGCEGLRRYLDEIHGPVHAFRRRIPVIVVAAAVAADGDVV